ncbi:polysaccharide biosynthesis protein [bacterium]|nr:polysaccharide biosynthesis protein [bacterium]
MKKTCGYLKNRHLLLIILADLTLFTISYAGSYLLRFDLKVPHTEYLTFKRTLIPIILLKLYVFHCFKLYRGMWRYTSLKEIERIIKASFVSSALIILFILITTRFQGYPRSVFLMDAMFTILLIGGFRASIRLCYEYCKQGASGIISGIIDGNKNGKRIIIIGAGDAGEKIIREINGNSELDYKIIGILDDDPKKINRHIHGIKIIGRVADIDSIKRDIVINEIIIAIPSASGEQMRRIIDTCEKTQIPYKTVPGINELIDGKVSISAIRDVSYSDLLGREQINLDLDRIGAYLKGKSVLVTGAGGSIGSEFCRQVARFGPETLIMLDRAESSLYDIEMEMKRLFPSQRIIPILGSVTCLERLRMVFSHLKPQVVFHAAAYKHVPMMEMHPWEAFYNNILGTKHTLDVALDSNVERFVLVSTDKAVRPTNIMGASKRIAEIILQLKAREHGKMTYNGNSPRIMAVRFGNVVGSAGSVIPLFKKQIAHGGPVTVTHPEITRYFMTISEAVQLILQAGAIGETGNIYILKMGKPIKIIDMAKDLINLSGFEPGKDIRIEITGLRPGEKIYEELITDGEDIIPTTHDKLLVLKTNGGFANGLTLSKLEKKIMELSLLVDANDIEGIKLSIKDLVPEYAPQSNHKRISDIAQKPLPGNWEGALMGNAHP